MLGDQVREILQPGALARPSAEHDKAARAPFEWLPLAVLEQPPRGARTSCCLGVLDLPSVVVERLPPLGVPLHHRRVLDAEPELPRLLKGRTRGPVFLTDRRAPAHTPTLDVCPVTGRARLSYRRAAELFETLTRPLAHPGITDPAELELCGGWTLHQQRHSALTHEAEDGTNSPTLLARSRHASVRSLERYARPGVDAVASHVAARDPRARRVS